MAIGENIKNILLTGTSGFLGGHIKSHLNVQSSRWRIFVIANQEEFESFEEKFVNQQFDVVIHSGFSIDFQRSKSMDASKNIENTRRVFKFSE